MIHLIALEGTLSALCPVHIPFAELVHCCLEIAFRLVTRIYTCVDHMRVSQQTCQRAMDLQREILECGFCAIEAMDINQ